MAVENNFITIVDSVHNNESSEHHYRFSVSTLVHNVDKIVDNL